MRIVGSMLIALLLESSLIGCELWSHHQPLSLSANISLGKDAKDLTGAVNGSGDPKGAYIGMALNKNKVLSVFPGSPADKAGIMAGDKIMDINGRSVFGEEAMGVADQLRGQVGSEVDVIIEHGDLLRKLSIIRALPTAEERIAIQAEQNWLKSPESGAGR
ncbi:MAG: PDZ domain-containing protein [Cyanobacteria bacterium REEB67]|nr:PDZ domain-containing protein [Cyanobacteria bacterium REEB67]